MLSGGRMDLLQDLLRHVALAREVAREGVPGPVKPFVDLAPDWAVLVIAAALLIGVGVTGYKFTRRLIMAVFNRKQFEASEPSARGQVQALEGQVSELTRFVRELEAQMRESNTVLAGYTVALRNARPPRAEVKRNAAGISGVLGTISRLMSSQRPFLNKIESFLYFMKHHSAEARAANPIGAHNSWIAIQVDAENVARLVHELSTLGNALAFAATLAPDQITALDHGLARRRELLEKIQFMPVPSTGEEIAAFESLVAEYRRLHEILNALAEQVGRLHKQAA